MAGIDRQILPCSNHDPASWIRQWRVIEVLTDVVLVEAHRTVGCKRQILGVGDIQALQCRAGVQEAYMPEPRRCILRQQPGERILDAEPRACANEHPRLNAKASGTAGPEQCSYLQG